MRKPSIFAGLFLVLLFGGLFAAPPTFPTTFYGVITTTSGTPIAQNLTASIGTASTTATVAGTSLYSCGTSTCNYYIVVSRADGDTSSTSISFVINNTEIGTGTFSEGAVIRLDFTGVSGSVLACLANCTNATTTTTTTTGGNSGGGGGGGGGGSSSSTTESETFTVDALRPGGDGSGEGDTTTIEVTTGHSYDSGSGVTTFSLKIGNTGQSGTVPLSVKQHIPNRIASTPLELTFSLEPTRFENGSVIAIWDFANGIPSGETYTITYSVKKRVSSAALGEIETTVAALSAPETPYVPEQPVAGPEQPSAQPGETVETPETTAEPGKKPAAPQQPAEKPEPEAGQTPQESGLLMLLIGFGAVLAVAAAMFFLVTKRKKKGM